MIPIHHILKISFNSFLAFILLGGVVVSFAADTQVALDLVKTTADAVLEKVSNNKQAIKDDPAFSESLVSDLVLPHFDFTKMTQTAMGKHWKRANEDQQAVIVKEFRSLLVRTYSVALLNYSGQKIEYLPLRDASDPERVTVQTVVTEADGGPKIPVDYRLFDKNGSWKVYDVVIDGVSLVSNYRTSFSGQIRRGGIDGLIAELQANNAKG